MGARMMTRFRVERADGARFWGTCPAWVREFPTEGHTVIREAVRVTGATRMAPCHCGATHPVLPEPA